MRKNVNLSVRPVHNDQSSETSPLVSRNPESEDSNADGAVGLTMKGTALLMMGEMVGGGVLALPRALVRTGWFGVLVILVMAMIAAFNAKRLADCWIRLEETKPEVKTRKRNPYAIIAGEAMGGFAGAVVTVMMLFTLFGASVVYMLMATQIIEQVLLTLIPTLTYCVWYLIVAGSLTPLMLFGTSKNFGMVGTLAFYTVLIACTIYFVQLIFEYRPFVFRFGTHGVLDFSLSLGTISFAFAGITTFPTILGDMADKNQYGKSLKWSFLGIVLVYVIIGTGGYYIYGESVAPNVAMSLPATPLTLAGHILMAIHLVCAFILLIMPVCQELEDLYNVGKEATWYGFLVRISIMAGVLFIGETIPRFYTILGLLGATTVALLTFVLPPLFYLAIFKDANLSKEEKLLCYGAVAVSAAIFVMASIANVGAITSTSLIKPCYL